MSLFRPDVTVTMSDKQRVLTYECIRNEIKKINLMLEEMAGDPDNKNRRQLAHHRSDLEAVLAMFSRQH